MYCINSFKTAGASLAFMSGLLLAAPAFSQSSTYIGGYKQIKRLGGTSESICRPAIRTADELQSFALNQRQDIIDILDDANWSGNPDVIFSAIEAGEFVEHSYPVGTKFEWMGLREKGNPVASEKRQWAGKQAFEGFELNVLSNCMQHRLVIPKPCCNVSLVRSSPVDVSRPVVSVAKDGQRITITVNSFGAGEITRLSYPDGHSETLTLSEGSWTGTLEPGSYEVKAISTTDCGKSAPILYTFNTAAPASVMATPAVSDGLFFAPFVGRQVRSIDPPLVGLQVGWLNAINDRTNWFVQGGGSYNLDASELSLFIDLGMERRIGEGGFIGAGLGLWDFNNNDDLPNSSSPKQDVSYFIHGGANTPWQFHERPVQWFVEARIFDDFTDDISHHNILKLGLRYMY